MNFPQSISFTITNRCNLRCRMCGQWSEEGYMHCSKESLNRELELADWKRLIDELADHCTPSLLLRGGEPFLHPDIAELLAYIASKEIFIAIDTNGTPLGKYVEEIVAIDRIHLTISVDGPEEIHDHVRGVKGTFARMRDNLALLRECEERAGKKISKSANFTISPYSLPGLGAMPEVARSLSLETVCIVPYYYFPAAVGERYRRELADHFDCAPYSWTGFHHEGSGVDFEEFEKQHAQYIATLDGLRDFPYMPLIEEEYRNWFRDATTPVGPLSCTNVEKLIDIQPDGEANFCVDFPDYSIGNVRESTIAELWNGERAERFRAHRRQCALAVCYRCGAKYMSEIEG